MEFQINLEKVKILTSNRYSYVNSFNNIDNIKIEINFIDRVHIYPLVENQINVFGEKAFVRTLSLEELCATKISALIVRSKARDLYDTSSLFSMYKTYLNLNVKQLVLFYLSLNGVFEINDHLFNNISCINFSNVKKELWPVLRLNKRYDLENDKEFVLKNLTKLIKLTEDEKIFKRNFIKKIKAITII